MRRLSASLVFLFAASLAIPACQNDEDDRIGGPEGGCLQSGGQVTTAACCQSTGDFPNSCLIGACGCGPNSHQVRVCSCAPGKCFDGTRCVDPAAGFVVPPSS